MSKWSELSAKAKAEVTKLKGAYGDLFHNANIFGRAAEKIGAATNTRSNGPVHPRSGAPMPGKYQPK